MRSDADHDLVRVVNRNSGNIAFIKKKNKFYAIIIYLVTIWKVSTQNKIKLLGIKSKVFLESASVTQAEVQELISGGIFDFVLSILFFKQIKSIGTY